MVQGATLGARPSRREDGGGGFAEELTTCFATVNAKSVAMERLDGNASHPGTGKAAETNRLSKVNPQSASDHTLVIAVVAPTKKIVAAGENQPIGKDLDESVEVSQLANTNTQPAIFRTSVSDVGLSNNQGPGVLSSPQHNNAGAVHVHWENETGKKTDRLSLKNTDPLLERLRRTSSSPNGLVMNASSALTGHQIQQKSGGPLKHDRQAASGVESPGGKIGGATEPGNGIQSAAAQVGSANIQVEVVPSGSTIPRLSEQHLRGVALIGSTGKRQHTPQQDEPLKFETGLSDARPSGISNLDQLSVRSIESVGNKSDASETGLGANGLRIPFVTSGPASGLQASKSPIDRIGTNRSGNVAPSNAIQAPRKQNPGKELAENPQTGVSRVGDFDKTTITVTTDPPNIIESAVAPNLHSAKARVELTPSGSTLTGQAQQHRRGVEGLGAAGVRQNDESQQDAADKLELSVSGVRASDAPKIDQGLTRSIQITGNQANFGEDGIVANGLRMLSATNGPASGRDGLNQAVDRIGGTEQPVELSTGPSRWSGHSQPFRVERVMASETALPVDSERLLTGPDLNSQSTLKSIKSHANHSQNVDSSDGIQEPSKKTSGKDPGQHDATGTMSPKLPSLEGAKDGAKGLASLQAHLEEQGRELTSGPVRFRGASQIQLNRPAKASEMLSKQVLLGISNIASGNNGSPNVNSQLTNGADPAISQSRPVEYRAEIASPEALRTASLKVQLEDGGLVRARIHERSGAVQVQMTTDDLQMARGLTSGTQMLRQSLDASGLKLHHVEVSYQGSHQRRPDQEREPHRPPQPYRDSAEQNPIFVLNRSDQ